MHPAAFPPAALLEQCVETRTRRGGPGGQHRNKVETAVVLLHRPTGLAAEASERRSQSANRSMAIKRLRLLLALEHRQPASPNPSPLWQSRVRGRQLLIAADHDDYPTLLAEALDQLHAVGWNMPQVAQRLGVTSSQLAKLFRKNTAACVALNRLRTGNGLPPLK